MLRAQHVRRPLNVPGPAPGSHSMHVTWTAKLQDSEGQMEQARNQSTKMLRGESFHASPHDTAHWPSKSNMIKCVDAPCFAPPQDRGSSGSPCTTSKKHHLSKMGHLEMMTAAVLKSLIATMSNNSTHKTYTYLVVDGEEHGWVTKCIN